MALRLHALISLIKVGLVVGLFSLCIIFLTRNLNDPIRELIIRRIARHRIIVPEELSLETTTTKQVSSSEPPIRKIGGLISHDLPTNYKGPIVEGWPPEKNRSLHLYIRPKQNTFLLMPEKLELFGIKIVIIVLTGDKMWERRKDNYETWMQDLKDYPEISVINHVGKSMKTSVQRMILSEQKKYGNILQSDMEDSYTTVTIKEIMSFKYILEQKWKIPPDFIMKVDDDTYVNIPALWRALYEDKKYESRMDDLLVGYRYEMAPLRIEEKHMGLKYTLPIICPEYMFNGAKYPFYLSGGGYVMSYYTMRCIYEKSLDLPFFHINDVFVTGFCAESCGIERMDDRAVFHPGRKELGKISEADISIHHMDGKTKNDAWNRIKSFGTTVGTTETKPSFTTQSINKSSESKLSNNE